MLKSLDAVVIDSGYQPLSDWFSDHHHKTPFLLTRICIYLYLLADMTNEVVKTAGRPDIVSVLLGCLFPSYILIVNRGEEARYETTSSFGTMNSMRIPLRFMRLIYLIVMPLAILGTLLRMADGDLSALRGVLQIGSGVCFFSAIYFVVCTPKPPKPQEDEIPSDAALEGV